MNYLGERQKSASIWRHFIGNWLISFRKLRMNRHKSDHTAPDVGSEPAGDRAAAGGRGAMNRARYSCPPLRDLGADGFNENRQGVMMSGHTWEREVLVVVHANAIKTAFPKNNSVEQCVSFVERNLDTFRGLVNGKLTSGNMEDFGGDGGRRRAGCLVEIDFADLARSRRWMIP